MTRSIGKNFWEQEHKRNSGWLTGTTFDSFLHQYRLTADTLRYQKCLEIGVGRGTITQQLSTLSSLLYCCDISAAALDKVKGKATAVYLSQDLDQVPPVDIAVCHLVLVHCDDRECERILGSIKLGKQGRIFCQFSSFKDADIGVSDASQHVVDMLDIGNKHYFRTTKQILDIIESAGLVVESTWSNDPGAYFGWTNQVWNYYELRK